MKSLSHHSNTRVTSHTKNSKSQRDHKKQVQFSSCTTDIITSLYEKNQFRFSSTRVAANSRHCRPILKYSEDMTEYLRRTGSAFSRALSALGVWCTGVTSDNPNIRSDMYKQLVSQIRGTSPHLRQAAESILQANVHGMWVQLVDDFSMKREEYTTKDIILYENAAQLVGIVLSNHRLLERLDVLDVQTFVLEIVTRVDHHLQNKSLLEDRFQSHVWLLGCEVSGWWESQAAFYSQELCERLYDVITQINILTATPPVQRALLDIFRIVFARYPNLRCVSVEKVLTIAWDFMWHEDEQVKRVARAVVNLIADHRGGELNVFQIVKLKCRTPALLHYELCSRITDEIKVFPAEGLELWMTITRLLKENIINLANDRLYVWLQIPQELLSSKEYGRTAGIMICYLSYYCQSHIEKNTKTHDIFATPFKQKTRNPLKPLKALDTCLNAFYFNSPLQEPIPIDRPRQRPNLKIWARMTVDAMEFSRQDLITKELKDQTDTLVAHVFCHWDNLIRALMEVKSFEGYDEDQRTQDLIDICSILNHERVSQRIKDPYNDLQKQGKHAVHAFWFNFMAKMISRDQINQHQIFPVEILRSLLPMIIAGLTSTQIRIRQSTYRFVVGGSLHGGMRWLVEKDGVELLKAVEYAYENFEADTEDKYGRPVTQINDFGTMMLNSVVESGVLHPTSLKPMVPSGKGDINWVWFHPDGNEFPLGKEEVFTEEERTKVTAILEARASREAERLRMKEEERRARKERKAKKAQRKEKFAENPPRSPLTQVQKQESEPPEASTRRSLSKSPVNAPDISQSSHKRRNPPSSSKQPSNAQVVVPSSQQSQEDKSKPSPITQAKSQPPTVLGAPIQPSLSSMSTMYDKRMPPPSVDWRGKGGFFSRKPSLPLNISRKHPTASMTPINGDSIELNKKPSQMSLMDDVVMMVEEEQKLEIPSAKGLSIVGKRNQLDFGTVQGSSPRNDLEEQKTVNGYLRDDGMGIVSDSSEEVAAIGGSGRKRPHDDKPLTSTPSKKRKLRSEYCPASHTTWKPSWLDTTQCYPLDETGEDMSDVECLRGDAIHRSADKMKQILETECMYIPSHRIDELMTIAQETHETLKRTKEFYAKQPSKRIRIERHQFMAKG